MTSQNLKVVFEDQKIEINSNENGLIATGIKLSNQCYKLLLKNEEKDQQVNVASIDQD